MTLAESLALLRQRGPDHVTESSLLGGWLLARTGLEASGEVAVAPGTPEDDLLWTRGGLSGTLRRVPWAREASHIAMILDGHAIVVERSAARTEPRLNLAGDSRDTLIFDRASAQRGGPVDAGELVLRGALLRVALMAGALDRVYGIAVRHAAERRQFGRPIGSFQAVQQHLVTIAQQAALAGAAADATARRPAGFEIAAGKLLANRAALSATRAAHQVLGARGTTLEHPLGQLTRRLWAWRSEYGDEHHWADRLGDAVARAGADNLYPAITGGSALVSL